MQQFVKLENCNCFLILRHKDKSADIYINKFNIALAFISKVELILQLVTKNDISDLKALKFPDIEISKSDAIIFCVRIGWKFGLYFNFTANPKPTTGIELDLDQINIELGRAYRFMLYEEDYSIIKNNEVYPQMLLDGWFPFIELIVLNTRTFKVVLLSMGRPNW